MKQRHDVPRGRLHLVRLVQTAANVPLFLLAIPAGVFADLVERRRLIRIANSAMFVIVATLAVMTAAHHVTPAILLAFTFALYTAASVQEPAWAALVTEIVDEPEVPAAIALNSINFNLSRIVGPTVAGLVVAAFGPAACVYRKRTDVSRADRRVASAAAVRPPRASAFADGLAETVDLIRSTATLRALIIRTSGFAFVASALWALLPVLARHLHADAPHYGAMIAALGVGAILVGSVMSRIRAELGVSATLGAGISVLGVSMATLGATDRYPVAMLALFVGGFGWLIAISSYNTALSMPSLLHTVRAVSASTSLPRKAWSRPGLRSGVGSEPCTAFRRRTGCRTAHDARGRRRFALRASVGAGAPLRCTGRRRVRRRPLRWAFRSRSVRHSRFDRDRSTRRNRSRCCRS